MPWMVLNRNNPSKSLKKLELDLGRGGTEVEVQLTAGSFSMLHICTNESKSTLSFSIGISLQNGVWGLAPRNISIGSSL